MLTLVVTKPDSLDRSSEFPDVSIPEDDFSDVPFLKVKQVDSPAKQLYFLVQRMMIENDLGKYQAAYFDLISNFLSMVPSTRPLIESASIHVACGDYRASLRAINLLIEYETYDFGRSNPAVANVSYQASSEPMVGRATVLT